MLGKSLVFLGCVMVMACGETQQPTASAAGGGASKPDSVISQGGAGQASVAGQAQAGRTASSNQATSASQAGTKAPPPAATTAGQAAPPPPPPPPPAATAGTTAQPSAGSTASGPVAIEHPEPKRSAGCGMPAPMAGNASIDIMGTMRDYILALPKGYDSNKPYKLIFAWHGLGGSAQQVASNWYGLQRMSEDSAIFVAGQGLMTMTNVGDGAGWPNTNGQDVAFVKALYAQLQNTLCLDENRVFSTGMSYGGIMSNTLGCQMGDVIRAIAPMSGSGPGFGGRGAMCVGEVAVWMSHGDNDTVVPTSAGDMSRDYWVNANHCQMQNTPVDPSPCVAYAGCDTDAPVTFCKFMGGHTVPPFASAAIWKFFSQF